MYPLIDDELDRAFDAFVYPFGASDASVEHDYCHGFDGSGWPRVEGEV